MADDDRRTLVIVLDEIAHEALVSGDQRVLELVEEANALIGSDE